MNDRYVFGSFDFMKGIWANEDKYRPDVPFVIDNLFVYCDNSCVKHKWGWGAVGTFHYNKAMKVLE